MSIRRCFQAALIATVALFLMTATASASPCVATNVGALLNTSCQIGNLTFTFGNLPYSPTGSDAPAAYIQATPFNSGSGDGWTFQISGYSPSTWHSGFSIAYAVSVTSGNPTVAIVGTIDQIYTNLAPNSITATDVETPGTLLMTGNSTGCPGLNPACNETAQLSPYLVQSLNTVSSAGVNTAGVDYIQSYSQTFFEGSNIPEPATFSLIGGALLGLGILGRKRFSRG
jgi:hypothetical protein